MRFITGSVFSILLALSVNSNAHAYVGGTATSKCTPANFPPNSRINAVVNRVVDGDTIKIDYKGGNYNIRMLTIDTPETHFQGRSQGYWGDKAAAFLSQTLPLGTRVQLAIDNLSCDHYGRVLAIVFSNGININKRILEAGMAVNYCIYPNVAFCAEFAPIVAKNVANRAGIFSDATLELPYLWRAAQRGTGPDKFVGDIYTRQVGEPQHVYDVPVANRIFFMKESDVHPPFVVKK